jgi:transposase
MLHNICMLDVQALKVQDLVGLSPQEMAQVAQQMLAHIDEQGRHIDEQRKRIDSQAQAIKWRDAKIESITFQLARLKAWKFGAKTERMNAVGAGANVLSFGRFENADGFAAAFA